jgi:pyruvate kinase
VRVQALVTVPPHAAFLDEVAAHPLVSGLRLNTVMPIRGGPAEVLERLAGLGQPLWVDLKGRQLRVREAAVPPFTAVRASHRITVSTPCDIFFSGGREHARLLAADGDRLILEDGPRRVVGPGESINIVDPSLEVEGYLTESDVQYLESMKLLGLRHLMLSYAEEPEDVRQALELLPDAEIILKIESRRGLDLARRRRSSLGRLMAARGDLYVEVLQPHAIIGALQDVIAADPGAIAASRLFPSLARHPVPEAAEIADAAFLMAIGYRTLLLGDEVCLRRDSVISALNLLEATAGELA